MKKTDSNMKKIKGFTLVELIVILVILAILSAILIPALTGYIDKAREKQVLVECHFAVEAAQTIEYERYAKDQNGYVTQKAHFPEIKELAEVPGEILLITVNDGSAITRLEYRNHGMTAIYEKGHKPELYIKDDSRDHALSEDLSSFKDYAEWVKTSTSNLLNWNRYLEWADENNVKELPAVSDEVKKGSSYEGTDLYWHPYIIGSGENRVIIYVANKRNQDKTNSASSEYGNIISINGTLYEHKGGDSNAFVGKLGSTYDSAITWFENNGEKYGFTRLQ